MPLTSKGSKILKNFVKQYGSKLGKKYFYSSINEGKITGAEGSKKKRSKKKGK